MAGFQPLQVAGRGVDDERGEAPAVTFLEQRQLRAGVGSLTPRDDSHLAGQPEQAGQVRDVSAVTDVAVGPDLRRLWSPLNKNRFVEHAATLGVDAEVIPRKTEAKGFQVVKRRWVVKGRWAG